MKLTVIAFAHSRKHRIVVESFKLSGKLGTMFPPQEAVTVRETKGKSRVTDSSLIFTVDLCMKKKGITHAVYREAMFEIHHRT